MKFNQYPIAEELKEAIDRLEYKKPTDIQYKAIPSILKGEDVLAIAQTGTGKTAAFVIPILDKIHEINFKKRSAGIKCIVMVPTRELAIQINDVFKLFGKKLKVKSMALVGGVDQDPQIKNLEKGLDVLVATPGRMFDLYSQGYIRLNKLKYLVLDEADHMLDLGFIKDINDVVKLIPKKRQTLFFSATIDENIKKIAYSLVHKPVRIQISPKDPISKNVDHSVIFVPMDEKRFYLERLVNENEDKKLLVFVRTKVRSERVQAAMARVGISATVMHGGIDQKDRLSILNDFANGTSQLLIATDVSARGIDIPDIDFVVNYDLPDHPENYVHRVGRTGRGRKKGMAFSFCSPKEKPLLEVIQTYITKEIKELKIKSDDRRSILELTDKKNLTMDDIEDIIQEPIKGKRAKRKKIKKYKK